jgi:CrcB protein
VPARDLSLVAAGGALGVLARYGIGEAAPVEPGRFPLTTFALNVGGAFVLGVVLEWLTRHHDLEHWVRFVVGVGVLGAFTTFSTFMVETVQLVRDGHTTIALGYAAASVAVGVAATFAGLWVAGWRGARMPIPPEGES